MNAKVSAEQRLLSLAIALRQTRHGMTKREIFRKVDGYPSALAGEEINTSADRMFERDKKSLRTLGIDVETIGLDGAGEDVRYRIDPPGHGDYTGWFSPPQLALLGIAASMARTAAPQTDIDTALMKLRALGLDIDADTIADSAMAPESIEIVVSNAQARETIMDARANRSVVKFAYRAAHSGQLSQRTIEPWQIVVRTTGWYVVGFDRDRKAGRVFHFDRIVGNVTTRGRSNAYRIPDAAVIREATKPLTPIADREAELLLAPGRAVALRKRAVAIEPAQDGYDLATVRFAPGGTFARDLAQLGDAVVVRSPVSLRDEVIDLLRRAALGYAVPGDHTGAFSDQEGDPDHG
ncbi:helix-turn-helix transcriptional regulator [Rarobacter incanus]|uniref:Proteasome accessory factor B n=1 Tax=Rarobacter incanus TaxID=153494 RepID=A0A542SM18_9MICO|nr:WYL domain-containing protein [Rarobacter incanus]TQK75680.1 proteasome accessory factor B [Rarobacter incanus]